MHYSATAVIEEHGPDDVRRAIAAGGHLSTLAFSEAGSRSHFWAPLGTATADGDEVVLDAAKSWVTSAGEADSYVWTSRPVGDGGATLWLVPVDRRPEGRARAVRRVWGCAATPVEPGARGRRGGSLVGSPRRRRRRTRHRARRGAAGVPDPQRVVQPRV